MAESAHPLGYQCEFVDSVQENFYCKDCTLVARRLTLTTCCGESYCHDYIVDIQQQDKPCPECGEKNFTTMKPIKYQRQIDHLKVHCNMRGKGCGWLGPLDQLDTHLDPEQNHCQYVDVKCPLLCQHTIPRNKVEQHLARECAKRDHVCQYCGFRASYEVVVDTHLPQCIYFPLQCSNFCGVTCERDVIEDHMSICRLEEVACAFSSVGCNVRFRREEQEEHAKQNSQLHLTMTATAALMMNQQLQCKVQEQGKKLQELGEKLQGQGEKLYEQKEKLQEHEEKLQEQEGKFINKFEEQEKRFQEQECKFQEEKQKTEREFEQQKQELEQRFEELEQRFRKRLQVLDEKFVQLQDKSELNGVAVTEVENFINLKRTFAMQNFSKEKDEDKPDDWKSPAMYTHMCGYKFQIGIDANGCGFAHGKAMRVEVWAMQGEYDHQLKWPAHASFTIELLNQHGGENIIHSLTKVKWEKPTIRSRCRHCFGCTINGMYMVFIEHSDLKDFLANDTIYFRLSNIAVYSSLK